MLIILALCSQFMLADSLYARGYYEEARIEYSRVFYSYPQLRENIEARMRYAISLLKKNQGSGITEIMKLVNEFPELPDGIRREIAEQYIDAGIYYLAIDILRDTGEKDLLGMAYLLDGQYARARAIFHEEGNAEIVALIDDYLQNPEKSEKTAVLLSVFLPGAGEAYAGNPFQGIRDFLMNLGSGYLLYNALRQQKYVDATLVFVFLLNRFYLGSIYNAQKSVIEHNKKRRREWLDAIQQTHYQTSPAKRSEKSVH
jgi:hypothetical protein